MDSMTKHDDAVCRGILETLMSAENEGSIEWRYDTNNKLKARIKRGDIRGWTWKFGKFRLEFVTVHHVLREVCLWKHVKGSSHDIITWEW